MTDLLWLLVAFNNMEEVETFIETAPAGDGGRSNAFAVCDNSSVSTVSPRLAARSDVLLIQRPDNPGYLEGGLAALDAYVARHGMPKWVALSNTDMEFVTGDPWPELEKIVESKAIVAPRITEGADEKERNPHMLHRRTRRRIRAAAVVGGSTIGALVYQAVYQLRRRIRSKGAPRGHVETYVHPSMRKHMYAPFGAQIYFSGEFLTKVGLPRRVPLFTEEYFIAETARQAASPIIYVPSIHVRHIGHATTGTAYSIRRARLLSQAFRSMNDHSKHADD